MKSLQCVTDDPTTHSIKVFSFATPASCSILSCINVIAEAVCIADAIEEDKWKDIFTCAKQKEVCITCSSLFHLDTLLYSAGWLALFLYSLPARLLSNCLPEERCADEWDRCVGVLAASVRWVGFWRSMDFADDRVDGVFGVGVGGR